MNGIWIWTEHQEYKTDNINIHAITGESVRRTLSVPRQGTACVDLRGKSKPDNAEPGIFWRVETNDLKTYSASFAVLINKRQRAVQVLRHFIPGP
jgi:hypothetical protein